MSKQQFQIRQIQKGGGTVTYGVTISHFFKNWHGVFVNVRESGGCLILESGDKMKALTDKELKQYATNEFVKLS